MNNKKSKVLVIALIISLVAILSVGTLAWFTAKDDVTNTIKLADNFLIDVYETDKTGAAIVNEAGKTVGQTYTNIMPGDVLHKDPTVWNNGGHPEWVRVNVTLSNYEIWAEIFKDEETVDLSEIFTGFDSNAWVRPGGGIPAANEDGSITYTFYLKYQLGVNEKYTLFTGVKIPEGLTSNQAKDMEGEFTIKVEAEAIQVENLGATNAVEAFAKLDDKTETD